MYRRLPALAALIALIALIAAFALGDSTADAQQSPTILTLVRNDDRSDDGQVDISRDRAMGFRTGSREGGYWLTSVELDMTIDNPGGTYPAYVVELRRAGGTGLPHTVVKTLTNPDSLSTGLNSFTVPGGYLLAPDTAYWIAFRVTDGTGANIGAKLGTTQADEQSGAAGWTISNDYYHKARTASGWTQDNTQTPQFVLKGHTDTTPPVVRSAAVSYATLTITFDKLLYEDSVPTTDRFEARVTPGHSGPDTETITVSRVDISDSTVTLSLARAVRRGMTTTVTYFPFHTSPPLRDIPGNEVARFIGQPVTNNTPDFEEGVIYEAVGGTDRVVRDETGRCIHESRPSYNGRWAPYAIYGHGDEACRQAAWNAHRRSMGEDPLPSDSEDFPAGSPPDLNDFRCPSGWERSIAFGQQRCAPRGSDAVDLSPERAQEFVRRGLSPSDATSTNHSRYLRWYFFMSGPEACGEGLELAYGDRGNGPPGCTPVSELVSCAGGNSHGVSGRICAAPAPDYSDFNRYPRRASPTTRINSTVSYTSSDPGDTGTQEYGTPGCMGSYWDDEKGGWVCTGGARKVR